MALNFNVEGPESLVYKGIHARPIAPAILGNRAIVMSAVRASHGPAKSMTVWRRVWTYTDRRRPGSGSINTAWVSPRCCCCTGRLGISRAR